MRFFALHDTDGSILHLVVSPPDAPLMTPKASTPEQAVTEIALPEELRASYEAEGYDALHRILRTYRVEAPATPVSSLRYVADEDDPA